MEEKVKAIFEEVMNLELENISDLAKQEVDSLDFINIMFKLDSELNIKISNEEILAHQLTDVSNFIQYGKVIAGLHPSATGNND